MKALDRKMLRDLAAMKGQAVAIGVVVACGIAVFVMANTTLRSLEAARGNYYTNNRFADLFVSLVRAPETVADRVAEIPGVLAVDHRVVEALTLDLDRMPEPVSGLMLSLPDTPDSGLNMVHLRQGRLPDKYHDGEVLVSEPFAEAHRLVPGDTLNTTIRGRREKLTVVGVALSPEYVIQLQPGGIFPDNSRFGVFWMSRRQLEAAADMEGAFNNLTARISPNASEDDIIDSIDRLLESYGGTGAYGREDQYSARFVDDEIKGLRTMGVIPPSIFLGVAAFLLNISLRRILTLQREQIAVLKAFGYTNQEVAVHYGKLISSIVIGGAIAGSLLGTWLAVGMTDMYLEFYRFPVQIFSPAASVYIAALILSMISGTVGMLGGISATVRLKPAEAMRPAPPTNYKQTIVERLGLQRFFSQAERMVIRELERRPIKAALTTVGIAFVCAILVVGRFGKDSIDYLIDFQFNTAERDDVRVQLVEAAPYRALHEFSSIPGVLTAEPFRGIPAILTHGPRSKRIGITGIASDNELFRLLDVDGNEVPLEGEGLVLSSVLAETLALNAGDEIEVQILEGERPHRTIQVSGFVDDFAGTAAYMSLPALNQFLREGRSISGAYLLIDPVRQNSVFRALKERPAVAALSLKKATIDSFMETIAENIMRMRMINIIFASVIAIGVVYSSARISFSERGRDLATLRVIGLTKGEVSGILLGELAVLTIIAIPLGHFIGYMLCLFLSKALETEMYRMPMIIRPETYGVAAVVVLLASLASALIVRRKIDHLDLVTALKVRE